MLGTTESFYTVNIFLENGRQNFLTQGNHDKNSLTTVTF